MSGRRTSLPCRGARVRTMARPTRAESPDALRWRPSPSRRAAAEPSRRRTRACAHLRPAADRADRPPHARPAPGARRAAGRRLPGGAARPLPQGVLPLRPDSCLELDLKSVSFDAQAPGLNDSASAEALRAGTRAGRTLPKEPADLWESLRRGIASSQALFAHCVGLSVNAVHEAWNRRPRALAHADRLAQAVDLDMAAAGGRRPWTLSSAA